jgi:hypothetical protein
MLPPWPKLDTTLGVVMKTRLFVLATAAPIYCFAQLNSPAMAQAGSTGGTIGNTDKSISGDLEVPRQPAKPRQHRAAPKAKASLASCNLGSVWANQVSDGISSIWTITADGTATEQGRGSAKGHAMLSGHTLTITWSIGIANGNYIVHLNEACTAGTGTTTVLGGVSAGDVKSVIFARQS